MTIYYKDARKEVVERDRCCLLCLVEKGLIRPIEEVHHIIPRSHWGRDNDLKHDPKNLVGLCRECHNKHSPHVQSYEMIGRILAELQRCYGYDYDEPAYAQWRSFLE